jgi:hypothetical protein
LFFIYQIEKYEPSNSCQLLDKEALVPEVFKVQDEMDLRCKDRIKKDNHNFSKKNVIIFLI